MSNSKHPCHCPTCKGALVSESTFYRHKNQRNTTAASTSVPSFAAWSAQRTAGSTSSSRSNVEQLNPHKRLRADEPGVNIVVNRRNDVDVEMRGIDSTELCINDNYNDNNDFDPTPNDNNDIDPESDPPVPHLMLPRTELNPGSSSESDNDDLGDPDSLDALNLEDEERRTQEALLDATSHEPEDSEDSESDGGADTDPGTTYARVESIKISQQFIDEIRAASLDNGGLDASVIDLLRNPSKNPPDISDPDIRLSIDLYLAVTNASEATYTSAREAVLRRYPDSCILSYHRVKRAVAELSGVVSVADDMCINSCHAFTGPFANRDTCFICGEPRYDQIKLTTLGKKVPRQQAETILLGPQLQALRRSVKGARDMLYRDKKTTEIQAMLDSLDPDARGDDIKYDDFLCGSEYLDLVERLKLTRYDIVISGSLDGAQLYQNKKSDVWMYIWIVEDMSPDLRYKKKRVLGGGCFPGPNKPKITDSFLFRGLHHLSALQRENNGTGIHIWDGLDQSVQKSRIIFALATADALGLAEVDGRVGHHGARGCRLGCSMKGRHKPNSGHYYAAHLRPNNYTVNNCSHPDFDFEKISESVLSVDRYKEELDSVVKSISLADFERNRKATGISKPTILSGLHPDLMFPVPKCFCTDIMHLLKINIEELLLGLWRGTIPCDPTDDKSTWPWMKLVGETWIEHGQRVADATAYLPSSFHRPPRNPVEKLSSGYKATEYFLYLFGLGPGLFRTILPHEYWQNLCKLVRGGRVICEREIMGVDLKEAFVCLTQFVEEYENLYYQRRVDRLHFCRPCIHTLLHLSDEAVRVGPGAYYSQFTMERTIGDLGAELKQPSNPFANLSQRAVRRAQVNALKNLHPELDQSEYQPPRGSRNLGAGYILLRAKDRSARVLLGPEGDAIYEHCQMRKVLKWARLKLPNGQIARSAWKEKLKPANRLRVSRNVKFKTHDGIIEYGEVQFFFLKFLDYDPQSIPLSYALVSVYSRPNPNLLADSFNTLWACKYRGTDNLHVIKTCSIISVVSMQPLPAFPGEDDDYWFMVEKPGLDDARLTGDHEIIDDE